MLAALTKGWVFYLVLAIADSGNLASVVLVFVMIGVFSVAGVACHGKCENPFKAKRSNLLWLPTRRNYDHENV